MIFLNMLQGLKKGIKSNVLKVTIFWPGFEDKLLNSVKNLFNWRPKIFLFLLENTLVVYFENACGGKFLL